MIYELLLFDKIYLFAKNLEQDKYQYLLQNFAENINPDVGYEVIEANGDEIIPLEELPVYNQKIVVFDDIVCERNQNSIINYFIKGWHRKCCAIYLTQEFYKVLKIIRDNYSHFCILNFHPRENKRIGDELGVDRDILARTTDEDYSFFYYDKGRKLMKKNFDEDI